jgi:two-component system response regulator HydG
MSRDGASRGCRDAQTLESFESRDASMTRCLELARVAAQTDLPILILGESGSGKTLLARAIHNSSRRARGPFVSFNAAALSETLLDSQLFGHERGAFTGAERTVKGKFELADGGSLFIDEIADMSPTVQARILRAVEYGEFERLGSEGLRVADVRLISATHWPLAAFVESGRFRRDLFYRIGGFTLTVPALRDRPNDLRALLATEVRAESRRQGKTITGLDRGAVDRLLAHAWPGNLRELKTVIQAAVALTPGEVMLPGAVLVDQARPGACDPAAAPPAAGTPDDSGDLRLRTAERRHIDRVLARVGGSKRRAARVLGISRSTLDRKLGATWLSAGLEARP